MAEIFDIIMPIFGIMALAYGAAWFGIVDKSVTDGLSAYVHRIAVPLLVFRFVATSKAPETAPLTLLLCYFGAMAIVWTTTSLLARHVLKTDGTIAAIAGTGSGFSNTVMLGLPLIVASYGDAGALIFFILLPFHLPLVAFSLAIQVEVSRGQQLDYGQVALSILLSVIKNPIIIGIAAGLVFRYFGFTLSHSAETISKSIADTAIPCALFSMGLTLYGYGIMTGLRTAILISTMKLVLLPALVWFFTAQIAQLDDTTVGVMTIFASAPVGINVFILASQYEAGTAETSSAIALSSALSIFTISLVLAFLGVG